MIGQAALTGARESNAGDDFHVLWATRRVLGLLDPSSDLRLVVMEDLYPAEPQGVDSQLLLGVDLSEYYGSESLSDATRVVVSQLKYSHRHPGQAWTAARLGRRNGKRPGVTRRLADVHRGLAALAGDRNRLLEVLEIRLVSNQPISAELAQALRAAQEWLAAHPTTVNTATLLAHVNSAARKTLERLLADSGLKRREFTDFLRVLSLDGAQLDRTDQELALTAAIGSHVAVDLERHSRALYELVRKRALPEKVDRPVRVEDVLAALTVSSLESLFPHRPGSPLRRM